MAKEAEAYDWLDLKRLRYFIQIADMGSYSKAAAALAVGQPALSKYIGSLEKDIGTPLFYRDGRGVKMTEAGQRLFKSGKSILAEVAAAKFDIDNLESEPHGRISLGMPRAIGRLLIGPIAKRFAEEMPYVKLHIAEGPSAYILDWLSEGRADVTLHYDQPNLNRVAREPMLSQDLYLVGPPSTGMALDASVPIARLGQLALILPGQTNTLRLTLEAVAGKAGFSLNVPVEVDSATGILDLVEAGLGYSVLPLIAFHDAYRTRRVAASAFLEPSISLTLMMIATTHRPITAATDRLMEIIRQEARRVAAESPHFARLPGTKPIRSTGQYDCGVRQPS